MTEPSASSFMFRIQGIYPSQGKEPAPRTMTTLTTVRIDRCARLAKDRSSSRWGRVQGSSWCFASLGMACDFPGWSVGRSVFFSLNVKRREGGRKGGKPWKDSEKTVEESSLS